MERSLVLHVQKVNYTLVIRCTFGLALNKLKKKTHASGRVFPLSATMLLGGGDGGKPGSECSPCFSLCSPLARLHHKPQTDSVSGKPDLLCSLPGQFEVRFSNKQTLRMGPCRRSKDSKNKLLRCRVVRSKIRLACVTRDRQINYSWGRHGLEAPRNRSETSETSVGGLAAVGKSSTNRHRLVGGR